MLNLSLKCYKIIEIQKINIELELTNDKIKVCKTFEELKELQYNINKLQIEKDNVIYAEDKYKNNIELEEIDDKSIINEILVETDIDKPINELIKINDEYTFEDLFKKPKKKLIEICKNKKYNYKTNMNKTQLTNIILNT